MNVRVSFSITSNIDAFDCLLNSHARKAREESMDGVVKENSTQAIQNYVRHYIFMEFSERIRAAFPTKPSPKPSEPFVHDTHKHKNDKKLAKNFNMWVEAQVRICDNNVMHGRYEFWIEDHLESTLSERPKPEEIGRPLDDLYEGLDFLGFRLQDHDYEAVIHKTITDIKSLWFNDVSRPRETTGDTTKPMIAKSLGLKLTG